MAEQKNKVDQTRRNLLISGTKYAALVPASTLIVTKSARASGSSFTFSDGTVANNEFDCINAVISNPALAPEFDACVNSFGSPF